MRSAGSVWVAALNGSNIDRTLGTILAALAFVFVLTALGSNLGPNLGNAWGMSHLCVHFRGHALRAQSIIFARRKYESREALIYSQCWFEFVKSRIKRPLSARGFLITCMG